MDPGYRTTPGIPESKPTSQWATDAIERGKPGLAEAGLSAVVRVPGWSVTGKRQFDRVGGEVDGSHAATAGSRDQGRASLEEFRRQDG